MKTEEENKFCKKIIYQSHINGNRVILGLIVNEDTDFLTVKTSNKEHTISKKLILSIESTKEIYKGDLNDCI